MILIYRAMKKILSLLCLLGLLWSSTAFAALINVNFTDAAGGGYTGKAVVGSDGDQWNTINLPLTGLSSVYTANLKDSGGNLTGINLSTTATAATAGGWRPIGGSYSAFHTTSYAGLMDGYLYANDSGGAGGTITFSGLRSNTGYDIYIYSEGDLGSTGRKLSVTVNGTEYTTTAANSSISTFVSGQNYLQIHAITDASGNLNIGYNPAAFEANINGIQIVPEPGTIVLLGIGGLAATAIRKQKEDDVTEA
jgi:hypothetical protein